MDETSLPDETEMVIRAAGGIVQCDDKVLIVHRPRYDDWSLPKGKLEPGESWSEGALREVEEETGFRCDLGDFAQAIEYTHQGRRKVVAYYHMSPAANRPFEINEEVDQIAWVQLAKGIEQLDYATEKAMLEGIQRASEGTST